MATFDAVIQALEAERQKALPVLARAKGVPAETLFKAIKTLDDKLAELRAKRGEFARRMERTARLQEINEGLREIRQELDGGTGDTARREHLKRLGIELATEARWLVAELKKASLGPAKNK